MLLYGKLERGSTLRITLDLPSANRRWLVRARATKILTSLPASLNYLPLVGGNVIRRKYLVRRKPIKLYARNVRRGKSASLMRCSEGCGVEGCHSGTLDVDQREAWQGEA